MHPGAGDVFDELQDSLASQGRGRAPRSRAEKGQVTVDPVELAEDGAQPHRALGGIQAEGLLDDAGNGELPGEAAQPVVPVGQGKDLAVVAHLEELLGAAMQQPTQGIGGADAAVGVDLEGEPQRSVTRRMTRRQHDRMDLHVTGQRDRASGGQDTGWDGSGRHTGQCAPAGCLARYCVAMSTTPAAADLASVLDLSAPAVLDDPYPALAAARELATVGWHSGLGCYLVTSHAGCNAVLRDRSLGRIFRDREPETEWDTFNWLHADSILDSEPPKHTRLRRLIAGAFGRGHVARLGPRIAALTETLLDDCAARIDADGEVDLIEHLAEPLPVLVIAELLGFPEQDVHLLRPWSQAIVRMYEMTRTREDDLAAQQACGEFAAYVQDLATHRVAHPGEDLLSDLVAARDGSDRLSHRELVATAVLLLNAGHEATVNGFGNGMGSWLPSAAYHRYAGSRPPAGADLGLDIGLLVEEMLRHDSPSQLFERTATQDCVVEGVHVRAGDRVAVLLGAANRDPLVFEAPDEFRPDRDPNPQLSFGAGIHFCVGAPLARLELSTSLTAVMRRWPQLHVVRATRRPTFVLRGYEQLIVASGLATGSGPTSD